MLALAAPNVLFARATVHRAPLPVFAAPPHRPRARLRRRPGARHLRLRATRPRRPPLRQPAALLHTLLRAPQGTMPSVLAALAAAALAAAALARQLAATRVQHLRPRLPPCRRRNTPHAVARRSPRVRRHPPPRQRTVLIVRPAVHAPVLASARARNLHPPARQGFLHNRHAIHHTRLALQPRTAALLQPGVMRIVRTVHPLPVRAAPHRIHARRPPLLAVRVSAPTGRARQTRPLPSLRAVLALAAPNVLSGRTTAPFAAATAATAAVAIHVAALTSVCVTPLSVKAALAQYNGDRIALQCIRAWLLRHDASRRGGPEQAIVS